MVIIIISYLLQVRSQCPTFSSLWLTKDVTATWFLPLALPAKSQAAGTASPGTRASRVLASPLPFWETTAPLLLSILNCYLILFARGNLPSGTSYCGYSRAYALGEEQILGPSQDLAERPHDFPLHHLEALLRTHHQEPDKCSPSACTMRKEGFRTRSKFLLNHHFQFIAKFHRTSA